MNNTTKTGCIENGGIKRRTAYQINYHGVVILVPARGRDITSTW